MLHQLVWPGTRNRLSPKAVHVLPPETRKTPRRAGAGSSWPTSPRPIHKGVGFGSPPSNQSLYSELLSDLLELSPFPPDLLLAASVVGE